MSRIGKKPIEMPAGVKFEMNSNVVTITGPKGCLSRAVPEGVQISQEGSSLQIARLSDDRVGRSFQGLVRTLLGNMVSGVSGGFEKSLEISGVGYRAELGQGVLKLTVGYSSPIEYKIPEGISIKVDKQVNIVVSGIDKQQVGMAAAEIRGVKPPEPYKGKGIRYAGETVRRKVGKSAGSK